jgi:adenosylcobinamide amidohydrolase
VRLDLRAGPALTADLGAPYRALSSAVLGGGLRPIRTWLNLQVPPDYARTDPEAHLREVVARLALPGPVAGMLTAADVARRTTARRPLARAVSTVGIGQPLAAAGRRPRSVRAAGTINVLVVSAVALTDAALAGALLTVAEAKAQALADAGVRALNHDGPATGTATDSVLVAAPVAGAAAPFAGPATRVGADIAAVVHAAVHAGALAHRTRRPRPQEATA